MNLYLVIIIAFPLCSLYYFLFLIILILLGGRILFQSKSTKDRSTLDI